MKLTKEQRLSEERRWINALRAYGNANPAFDQAATKFSDIVVNKLNFDFGRTMFAPISVNGVEHVGLFRIKSNGEAEVVAVVPNPGDEVKILIEKSDSDAQHPDIVKAQASFERIRQIMEFAMSRERNHGNPVLDA